MRNTLLVLATLPLLGGRAAGHSAVAATPGSVCWIALQTACPFEAGAECAKCTGAAQAALARAGCAASSVGRYCSAPALSFTHRTVKLSSPRRNVGATSVGGRAVFAGGCNTTGTDPTTAFICDSADPAVDVFGENGELLRKVLLNEPRGWICAAPLGDSSVVLAGGGTSGVLPHSTRADVLDLNTGALQSYPHALAVGRWGIGCATVGQRSYFTGAKNAFDESPFLQKQSFYQDRLGTNMGKGEKKGTFNRWQGHR